VWEQASYLPGTNLNDGVSVLDPHHFSFNPMLLGSHVCPDFCVLSMHMDYPTNSASGNELLAEVFTFQDGCSSPLADTLS
jgi:hypothetical protein